MLFQINSRRAAEDLERSKTEMEPVPSLEYGNP
jgi:hypothetical protein